MILAFSILIILLANSFSLWILIIILVASLLIALYKLGIRKKVTININNEKYLKVKSGATLLSTLAEQNIFLPSVCGGSGTCGKCKCKVLVGGGSILPIENIFFNQVELANNWRLSCQVKVTRNMKIQLPK